MKRAGFKSNEINWPPRDQPWIWLPTELIRSPAWRARSINCVRFIDYLIAEHSAHAGSENGRLLAPYRWLEEQGIGRRLIAPAIDEAVALGLAAVERGGKKGLVAYHLSRYRLTFYATLQQTKGGAPYWCSPTNEWRRLKTIQDARSAIETVNSEREKRRRMAKNVKQVHQRERIRDHERVPNEGTKVNLKGSQDQQFQTDREVHESEPLSIYSVAGTQKRARCAATGNESGEAARSLAENGQQSEIFDQRPIRPGHCERTLQDLISGAIKRVP